MCFYIPELTSEDIDYLTSKGLIKKALGANVCRIYVHFENGTELDSGRVTSGDDGGGSHLASVYGKAARGGHQHDAEIKAMANLGINAAHTGLRGTLYMIGSSGPCDSCKDVLNTLRDQHPRLQCKILYSNAPETSYLQDKPIRYGWFEDRASQVNGDSWRYHYVPSKVEPSPLNEQQRHQVVYGRTQLAHQIGLGRIKLKDAGASIPNLKLKKRSAEALTAELKSSLWRVQVACNTWGERRRFGRESASVARDAVVAVYKLNVLETAEFDRRLTQARLEGLNWVVPDV